MAGKAKALHERFDKLFTPEPNSGCWLWLGHIASHGYGQFRMSTDPKVRPIGAHRASYILHCGPITEGMQVCHKCDNRSCVNPDHLFVGTAFDNMRDAAQKGRMNWRPGEKRDLPTGERHHAARITADDVRAIRSSDEPGINWARRLGITNVTVSRIRRNLIWRDVP